jgi:hypothetical protein
MLENIWPAASVIRRANRNGHTIEAYLLLRHVLRRLSLQGAGIYLARRPRLYKYMSRTSIFGTTQDTDNN